MNTMDAYESYRTSPFAGLRGSRNRLMVSGTAALFLFLLSSFSAFPQESETLSGTARTSVFPAEIEPDLVREIEIIKASFREGALTNETVVSAISDLGRVDYVNDAEWGKPVRRPVRAWRQLRSVGVPALYALIKATEAAGDANAPRSRVAATKTRELALGVIYDIGKKAGKEAELLPVFSRSLRDTSPTVRTSAALRIAQTAQSMTDGTHDATYFTCIEQLRTRRAGSALENGLYRR